MKGYIYLITNLINRKKYIGLTTQTVAKRYRHHLYAAEHHLDTMPLHLAMNEFGIENFKVEEIECVTASDGLELSNILDEREKYYIDKYNVMIPNGYNATPGGSGYTENRFVMVDCYDLFGNFLCTYDSYSDAGDDISNTAEGSIRKCCLGISKFAFQRIWRLHGDPFDKYELPDLKTAQRDYKLAPVDQYSLNGEFIKTFDSIASASLSLGFDKPNSHIGECCMKKLSTAYGFIWRYHGNPYEVIKDKRNVSIAKYSKNDEYIETFDSLKSACLSFGRYDNTISSNIRKCASGKVKSAYGFKWKYAS